MKRHKKNQLLTIILTGLSGAGKTVALNAFEDSGFFCVDNLPLKLIETFVTLSSKTPTISKIAIGIDIRERKFLTDFSDGVSSLREKIKIEIIFLEASDEALIRRFKETRRPHPLGHKDLDLPRAQELMSRQLDMDWPKELETILNTVHPLNHQICRPLGLKYYWSTSDTEYATDVMFKDADRLARLYPSWVHHAMSSFSSPDVMRFLGHYVPTTTGKVWGQFLGEVISDTKRRPEGVRVKHSVNGNSLKFYDKQGSVLRVETTIVLRSISRLIANQKAPPTSPNAGYPCAVRLKVDREERPDIDSVYMTICQMMTGSGGWPLSIIMTPDKRPFFAATYIPRDTRFGLIGMRELIPRIRELWANSER